MALLMATTIIGFLDYYTWLLVPGRLWQYLIWGVWGSVYTQVTRQAQVTRQTQETDLDDDIREMG